MNITYTGKSREFTAAEQHKLDGKFARIAKLVDRKGERKAQVVVTSTRHLHKAEIRMQFEERPLVGIASDPDFYQAVSTAVDKLEKQTLKVREKTRDHRGPEVKIASKLDKEPAPVQSAKKPATNGKVKHHNGSNGLAAVVAEASGRSARSAKIYRVDHKRSKPMTLDEAMLEIERNEEYFAFTDAKSGKLSVLVRRPDGHFDLVEG